MLPALTLSCEYLYLKYDVGSGATLPIHLHKRGCEMVITQEKGGGDRAGISFSSAPCWEGWDVFCSAKVKTVPVLPLFTHFLPPLSLKKLNLG